MTACQGGRIAIGKRDKYGFEFTVLVLLFDLKFFSVGLTFEDDLVTGVGQSVIARLEVRMMLSERKRPSTMA